MEPVTIVLPLFRTRDHLAELLRRLAATFEHRPIVVIGVDDADPDGSGDHLEQLAAAAGIACTIIRHDRNRGQHAALLTGIRAAGPGSVVAMDADLQDPPEVAPALLAPIDSGDADLVFARRSRFEQLSSRLFKKALVRAMDTDLPPQIGLYFALSQDARDLLSPAGDQRRPFLLGMLMELDVKQMTVPFERGSNQDRRSGYTPIKRVQLAWRAASFLVRRRFRRRSQ